jgi:antitoxin HigA-1
VASDGKSGKRHSAGVADPPVSDSVADDPAVPLSDAASRLSAMMRRFEEGKTTTPASGKVSTTASGSIKGSTKATIKLFPRRTAVVETSADPKTYTSPKPAPGDSTEKSSKFYDKLGKLNIGPHTKLLDLQAETELSVYKEDISKDTVHTSHNYGDTSSREREDEKDEGLMKEPLEFLLTRWGVPEGRHSEYAAHLERVVKERLNSEGRPNAQQANIQIIIANIMQKVPGYRVPKAPVHPGILIDRLLEQMEIPVAKAAERLEITREQLYRVIRGTSAVSPRLADILEKTAMGGQAEEWLFVQSHFDVAQLRLPDRPKARPRRMVHKASRP